MLASDPACERLAVTNGAEAASRLLLSGAALQLADEHGNACSLVRRRVRISLQWPSEAEGALSLSVPASLSRRKRLARSVSLESSGKICAAILTKTGRQDFINVIDDASLSSLLHCRHQVSIYGTYKTRIEL